MLSITPKADRVILHNFYFQNEARIRGQLNFDLNQDPPPDLVLEIDLTSKSLPRFPIYARLQEIPNLIEQYRAKGRRAIRQAVRAWVKEKIAVRNRFIV